jgi:hypothetical protein
MSGVDMSGVDASGNRASFHVTILLGDKGTGSKVLILVKAVSCMGDASIHSCGEGMIFLIRDFIGLFVGEDLIGSGAGWKVSFFGIVDIAVHKDRMHFVEFGTLKWFG